MLQRVARRYGLGIGLSMALCARALSAQDRELVGIVMDDADRPVPAAQVAIAGTYLGVASGSDGSFRLQVPSGAITVRVVRLGFIPTTLPVGASDGVPGHPLVIRLVRQAATLLGVVVPGERSVPLGQTVTRSTVRHVPPLGEPDVLRALAFLPGVSQPNDMLGRLHLAGAAGDETLVTLDGHPMQSPTHLSGIMGGFNVASVDRVEVLAHHVSAVQPTRLGGTVALSSRERAARPGGEAVGTLLGSSLTIYEPRLPRGLDVLASARLTYMDRLHRQIYGSARADGDPIPSYGDALARIGVPLGGRMQWQLEGIGFLSRDWTGVNQLSGARARTFSERLTGISLRGSSRHSLLTLRASEDLAIALIGDSPSANQAHLDLHQRWSSVAATIESKISDAVVGAISLGADTRNHMHDWSFGAVEVIGLPVRFRSRTSQSILTGALQLTLAPSERRSTSFGGRLSVSDGRSYFAPRIHSSWQLGAVGRVSLAFDRRYQFDTQFGEPSSGRVTPPTFLLSTPRRVDAVAVMYEATPLSAGGRTISFNATVFARSYVARTTPAAQSADTATQTSITFSRVRARSAGFASGLTWATTSGFVLQGAYTFTHAVEQSSVGWRPSNWETPHSVAVLASVRLGRGWTWTSALQYRSGSPVTPVLSQLLVPSPVYPGLLTRRIVLGERNSARLPGFHRLDFGFRRRWSFAGLEIDLSLQAVNVLARENVLEYDWQQYLQQREFGGTPSASRAGVPFVPSIGIEVRW